jgi:hypothetical protein
MVGVVLLLLGATACQTSTPEPKEGAMQTMPDLPDDPVAAKAVVRKMLMDEVIPLLKASGLKYTEAHFTVPMMDDTQEGSVGMNFDPCSDEQVQAMTKAIWAHGWKQGSISSGLHVRKGPLDIHWGNGHGGCVFGMSTDYVSQHLEITDDTTVPELAEFKAKGNLKSSAPDVSTGPEGRMTQTDYDNKYSVVI